MNHPASPARLFALALSEWLLVLPAALLLGGAALRQLQPPQHEPARTISTIFAWMGPRITHADAALLFLGLPGIAAIAGCVALLIAWRRSETLRQETVAVLASFRRHLAVAILGTGTLLAGAILAAVVIHIITD
jgi:hypothetical protein